MTVTAAGSPSALAGLAVLLACLGLFGLAAFAAERRTKEIGIRKAMGASTRDIVQLLSTDFAKLVLVAIAVAVPASWYAARQWLDGFAYRVELGPWVLCWGGRGGAPRGAADGGLPRPARGAGQPGGRPARRVGMRGLLRCRKGTI
jgi:hypothetical protein